VSRRAYDADREGMLLAYESVTPPRTPYQEEMRERLFEVVRAIRAQTLTAMEAGAGIAPKATSPSRRRQLEIPGT
jgi:hypothetical protein